MQSIRYTYRPYQQSYNMNNITIIEWNVRGISSINSKWNKITSLISSHNADITFITETNRTVDSQPLTIKSYILLESAYGRGSGVIAIIKKNLFPLIARTKIDKKGRFIQISLSLNGNDTTNILGLYLPAKKNERLNYINYQKKKSHIIIGDININTTSTSNDAIRFNSIISDMGLIESSPTNASHSFTSNKNITSLIDRCFYSPSIHFSHPKSVLLSKQFSDHSPLLLTMKTYFKIPRPPWRMRTDLDLKPFKEQLAKQCTDIWSLNLNPFKKWRYIKKAITTCIKHIEKLKYQNNNT